MASVSAFRGLAALMWVKSLRIALDASYLLIAVNAWLLAEVKTVGIPEEGIDP